MEKVLTQTSEIISTNPATGQELGRVQTAEPDQIQVAMQTARQAQERWESLGLLARLVLLRGFKDAYYRQADQLIDLLVAEQGKPRFEALVEYMTVMELINHTLNIAERTLAPHRRFVRMIPHRTHRVEYRPYGVVLVISPWNFPLLLSVAPILAALVGGNTVILKPSEYSTQVSNALTQTFHEGGIPPEVLQVVQGDGTVGAALLRQHPDKVCFTGSVSTGRKVAAAAGEMLIPVTLELGGKDAAIVLEDADLDRAAYGIVWGGMVNAGQVCASIERVYVMRPVADKLVEKMAAVLNAQIRIGPGAAQNTTMGAITTKSQIKVIDEQVREAVDGGARLVVGGRAVKDEIGQFYLPTLITDAKPDMRIVTEETFGPVMVIVPVDSHAEALKLANESRYGLTGSVWTRDKRHGLELARQMKVGSAGVNDHMMSSSSPNLPWGGAKESGYGRTRGSEGLLEMVQPLSLSAERLMPLPREFFWYPYSAIKSSLLHRLLDLLYGPTLRDKLRAITGSSTKDREHR